MAYPPGTVFAGFVLHRVLGAGGMGTVYLATHPRLPRYSALKLLSPELSHDPDFRRRFEQEAELAARLSHPNVVSVNDRGIDWNQLWIDMQYVEGEDCAAALVESGPMPVHRALRIVTEVGKGLDYAHRMGLLHRDVKPGNILLAPTHDPDDPERVMLADFGVAKAVDTTSRLTSTGSVVATLAYAAPEQIQAGPLDHRVDIYALGCVLYELLTGDVPFPGGTAYEIMGHHLTKAPPRPTERVPGLPAGFDEIIATALAKNRDDRYGSCRELTNAGWRAARAAPTHPHGPPPLHAPPPPPPPPPRPVYAPPPPPPVFAPPPPPPPRPGYAPLPPRPVYAPPPPPPPPPPPRPQPQPPPLRWPVPTGSPEAPRARPSRGGLGRLAAAVVLLASAAATFVVPGDDRQVETSTVGAALPAADPLPDNQAVVVFDSGTNLDLYVVNVQRKAVSRRLTRGAGMDRAPALSPDRQTVAYLSGEGTDSTLRVIAVDGSGDRPLFETPPSGCAKQGRPSWHPDRFGVLVVVCSEGEQRTLRLVNADGRLLQVYDLGGLLPIDPAFAPDGSKIIYAASGIDDAGGGSLYTVAADGRSAPIRLTDSAPGTDAGAVFSPTGDEIVFRRRVDDGSEAGDFEIYLMNADGTSPRALAADPAQDSGPGWSPDGSRILFMSEREGLGPARTNHLWIVNADGSDLSPLMRNSGGPFGFAPSWAPR